MMSTALTSDILCNCTALRRASRRVSQLYDTALGPVGLRSTQYAILAELDRREAPPTASELASVLVMDQSTAGQNLRPMERDGLVRLGRDPDDGRRRLIFLTKQGQALLAAARPLWKSAQETFEKRIGQTAASHLRGILGQIADNAEHIPA